MFKTRHLIKNKELVYTGTYVVPPGDDHNSVMMHSQWSAEHPILLFTKTHGLIDIVVDKCFIEACVYENDLDKFKELLDKTHYAKKGGSHSLYSWDRVARVSLKEDLKSTESNEIICSKIINTKVEHGGILLMKVLVMS